MKKLLLMLAFVPSLAFAQSSSEMCDTSAALVSRALELRSSGLTQTETVEALQGEAQGGAFASAIPTLVQIAYDFNLDLMSRDEAVTWYKQTCNGG